MKLLAPALLTGIYSLPLVLTKNTCLSSPPVGAARRFISGPLSCATNPGGLGRCTGTPILGFSVMLIGYMRVSSSDERQVVDLQLDACSRPGSTKPIYIRISSQAGAVTAPA